VVIGAGAAGLAAARRLCGAGWKVVILEARSRIGGRIFTTGEPLLPAPVELGAEFVHGRARELWEWIESAGLPVYDVEGDDFCYREGALRRCDDFFSRVKGVFAGMEGVEEQSFEDYLQRCGCDEEAKTWASAYVEGYDASDKQRIGVRALLLESKASEAIDGEHSYRLVHGYEAIPRLLLPPDAELYLNAIVTAVRWRRGHVEVEARTARGQSVGPFEARRCVVTLPLGVLQAPAGEPGAVRFDPEPGGIAGAVARLAMGNAVRLTIRFRERFWEERQELRRLNFLFSLDDWFPTWWTALPLRVPLLTGWSAGPRAGKFSGRGEAFVVEQALAALARLLGLERARLEMLLVASYRHDWQADPFARGAYSYVPAGALDAVETLAAPAEDTLYFAGEATDTQGYTGTVHGAIASGERAARQILEH